MTPPPMIGPAIRPQCAAAVSSSPYLVQDTFTDANGTAIADHMPDVGGAWSVVGDGVTTIQGDELQASGTGGDRITQDAGTANQVVSVVFRGDVSTDYGGLIARWTDDSNHWFAAYNGSSVRIYERTAGGNTLRASAAYTAAAGHVWTFTALGTSLTAAFDTVEINYTSSQHQTATGAGLRTTAQYGNETTLDDLTIEEAT